MDERSAEARPAAEAAKPRRRLYARASTMLALAVGVVAAIIATDFARFVTTLESREPRIAKPADGIVALTGGAERIADAITLLEAGAGRRLLITGVNQTTSDLAISAASPSTRDLLTCCIEIDRNALNTVGNAMEAARWVGANGFHSIIVVTSSYHMPRSLMELRRVLPDTELIAYPVVSHGLKLDRWWEDPTTLRLLVVEYAKYTGALLRLRFDRPTAATVRSAAL